MSVSMVSGGGESAGQQQERWLEAILEERYGVPLSVDLSRHDQAILCLPTECAVIELSRTNWNVGESASVPCAIFDMAGEGWKAPIHGKLPAPGAAELPSPLIEPAASGWRIKFDILGLAWWMLTRAEEIGRTDLDAHGRFPAIASHAYRHGYLERPIVDEWLHLLGQVIQRTWPQLKLKEHAGRMQVSHDVDRPARYGFRPWATMARAMAADVVRYRDFRALAAPWVRVCSRQRLHQLDAFNTFDWLMDCSEHRGLTSAFYFICDRRGTAHDAGYDLEHPAIRNLLRRIHARGHEIGLHPSYGTYLEPTQIRKEADRLRRLCAAEGVQQEKFGGRMHFLQWKQPETLRAWADAGLAYDSTLSYADHAGFRCGTCFEYPAFDPTTNQLLPLRIRPLIAMEASIMDRAYMGLTRRDLATAKIRELRASCDKVGGVFTLLWHNSSLRSATERSVYEEVLS